MHLFVQDIADARHLPSSEVSLHVSMCAVNSMHGVLHVTVWHEHVHIGLRCSSMSPCVPFQSCCTPYVIGYVHCVVRCLAWQCEAILEHLVCEEI